MRAPRSALVIGAGVVGTATAYALARRGIATTLLDRREGPALETSNANGAQLSYLYTDALASAALLPQMPGLLLGKTDAFRIRFSADPDFLFWLLRFLRNCTASRFAENTRAALELTLESRTAMAELLAKHPLDFGHDVAGKLHIYRNAAGFERVREVAALKDSADVVQRFLSPLEAIEIEPALSEAAPGILGALYSPSEAVGDPHRFSEGLLEVLQQQYHVEARFGFDASSLVLTSSGAVAISNEGDAASADIAVLCTGVDANVLLRGHGLHVPVQPMKGYSFTAPPGAAAPQISITEVDARFVVTNLDGAVRIAGLADLGERDTAIDEKRFATLLRGARAIMPQAANYSATYRHWAGLRPMSPNSRPHIARPRPALAYNLGHGMLGWTMAMGSAERLAALLTD